MQEYKCKKMTHNDDNNKTIKMYIPTPTSYHPHCTVQTTSSMKGRHFLRYLDFLLGSSLLISSSIL